MIGKSDGIFGYRVDRRKDGEGEPWIVITDYKGRDSEVHVPEKLDGISVKVLAKKAFLSKKNLKRVFLPESLEEVGDWSFAYCTCLESVWLPKKSIKLGNGVFMECPAIRRIHVYGTEAEPHYRNEANGMSQKGKADQTAALLAAAVALDAEYLLDIKEAGMEQWIQKWDARMKTVMETEDGDGYTRMVLCGEEDYGCSLEEFMKNKRKNKVRLAMLRLMNPIGLPEESEALWKEYRKKYRHIKSSREEFFPTRFFHYPVSLHSNPYSCPAVPPFHSPASHTYCNTYAIPWLRQRFFHPFPHSSLPRPSASRYPNV